MKYIVVLIMVLAAYVAGYFTAKEPASSVASEITSTKNSESIIQRDDIPQNMEEFAEVDQISASKSNSEMKVDAATNLQSSTESAQIPNTQSTPTPVGTNNASGSDKKRPLTDEQIDKLVPAPFNQYLKGHDSALLEKYRKFSEQESPSSQDSDISNKISDAIASNPYSKFLNIESFQCKANFCEIRLYESKSGVWSYIQAEMSLQDWWKFQSSSAHGFDTGKENVSGWYVLLTRD
ncbi:hypothetical protein [Cellvibrio sp. UBA7671]|uniref:hypothetical protein n=1 Tax=Cellvibrio sp. UBA7671 TaxID=1946312 RepID=UPI002F35DD0B